jgi:hypothetical protein
MTLPSYEQCGILDSRVEAVCRSGARDSNPHYGSVQDRKEVEQQVDREVVAPTPHGLLITLSLGTHRCSRLPTRAALSHAMCERHTYQQSLSDTRDDAQKPRNAFTAISGGQALPMPLSPLPCLVTQYEDARWRGWSSCQGCIPRLCGESQKWSSEPGVANCAPDASRPQRPRDRAPRSMKTSSRCYSG